MREVSASQCVFCPARELAECIDDVHRCPAPYPAEGAFVGSDLSGEVVKLGPNLQKDIKIGDVVGASVVGSTILAFVIRLQKLINIDARGGL